MKGKALAIVWYRCSQPAGADNDHREYLPLAVGHVQVGIAGFFMDVGYSQVAAGIQGRQSCAGHAYKIEDQEDVIVGIVVVGLRRYVRIEEAHGMAHL